MRRPLRHPFAPSRGSPCARASKRAIACLEHPGSARALRANGLGWLVVALLALPGCFPGHIDGVTAEAPGDDRDPRPLRDAGPSSPPPQRDAGPGSAPPPANPPPANPPPTPPTPPPGGDECPGAGDARIAPHVYYGTAEPTELEMTPGQITAVGQVDLGGGLCSGLVIAPRWVLTAKHCTQGNSAGSTTFRVGTDPADPDVAIGVRRFVDHPSVDMALLELDEDATVALPGLTPVRIVTESIDAWRGRTVEAAGYGQTERGTTGTRWFVAEPLVALSSTDLTVDGEGRHGVCFGDSGGPVMARATDGSVRVIGDLSGGDSSCVGQDHFTRVDAQRAWIEESTGPTPGDDGTGCGDLTPAGTCMGNQATWCDAGRPRTEVCGGDTTCGWDAAAAGYRCVRAMEDPCGGLDLRGRCEGNVARWCESGVQRRRDCGVCGQTCGALPSGSIYCLGEIAPPRASPPPSGGDPCEDPSFSGACEGNVAVWCEADGARRLDCAARGQTCAYVDAVVGYYCR